VVERRTPGSHSASRSVKSCEFSLTSPSTTFVPDPDKVYHIDNPAHGLRLPARSGSEILESAALTSSEAKILNGDLSPVLSESQ